MNNLSCCYGWNPWHHPYTQHCAWCPNYEKEETKENIKKNQKYNKLGGYYILGYPKDGLEAT